MELAQQLSSCKKCEKRKFDPNLGIVCSLTLRKPDFIDKCKDFIIDPKEASKIAAKSYTPAEGEKSGSSMSVWGVVAIIFVIIKIILRFARD